MNWRRCGAYRNSMHAFSWTRHSSWSIILIGYWGPSTADDVRRKQIGIYLYTEIEFRYQLLLRFTSLKFKILSTLNILSRFNRCVLTWSYILSSKRYTVHLSHLSNSLASVIIVLTRRSKLICSWNKLLANESKSWNETI